MDHAGPPEGWGSRVRLAGPAVQDWLGSGGWRAAGEACPCVLEQLMVQAAAVAEPKLASAFARGADYQWVRCNEHTWGERR